MPPVCQALPSTHQSSHHYTRQALPHTSLVLVSRKRARVRFARPSMFIVPRKLVLIVLMGLYLCHTSLPEQTH